MIGDRTTGRFSDVKQGSVVWPEVRWAEWCKIYACRPKEPTKPDDRAFVGARKRGNARGAKGRRRDRSVNDKNSEDKSAAVPQVGAKQVEEKHVRLAIKKVDQDRITEAIRSLPLHEKITLLSISGLKEINSTGEVYSKYVNLCKNIDIEPLTQRRVSGLLSELDLLGLISANIVNKGRHGRTKKISCLVPHETIRNIISEDSSISGLIKSN